MLYIIYQKLKRTNGRKSVNDENSNFMAVLKMRSEDFVVLQSCLKRTWHKWLHHDIQNDIIETLSNKILSLHLDEIKRAEFLGIMLDDASDFSRVQQISFVIWSIDNNLNVTEYFLGFHSTPNKNSETLANLVKDVRECSQVWAP